MVSRRVSGAVLLAALLAVIVPGAAAKVAPPSSTGHEIAAKLAAKAAARMARECTQRFCMDASAYETGCWEPLPGERLLSCGYALYGVTFVGDEPVGDFRCSRGALIGYTRRGRWVARSTGKTRCRDDAENHATYPWPVPGPCNDTFVIVLPDPISVASCVAPLPKPTKRLHAPLDSRGFNSLEIEEPE
jgi:hypothetical protein